MSNTDGRKRPHADGGGGATTAQDRKRRQIQQASWGLREVLSECGVLDFAAPPTSSGNNNSSSNGGDGNNNDGEELLPLPPSASLSELGHRLAPSVSPSGLRSSLHALLAEMDSNGIDGGNARVLRELEGLVLGGDDDDNNDNNNDTTNNNTDNKDSSGGAGAANGGSLLRRMLLPLYRVRPRGQMGLSQLSQPDGADDHPNTQTTTTKLTVESASLIKVLLRVDALQPTLLAALFQTLPQLASRFSDNENTAPCDEDVPRLIFANLRWLDHVVDGPSLTKAFVECVTVLASTSSECAKTRGMLLDALAALPDVLNDAASLQFTSTTNTNGEEGDEAMDDDDEGGNPLLAALQHLRTEDPSLLVPCLDAVGSLPLSEAQLENVTRDAVEALATVEPGGLPALTTFLMAHCPSGGGGARGLAREVVEELRKLPLGDAGDGDDGEDGRESDRSGNSGNDACVTIDALSRGLSHRPDLASTLLKAIKETGIDAAHPPADLWLLACCATASHNRPKVKALMKSKATAGRFTSRLVREALAGKGKALTSLFPTLCDVADGLVRSSSDANAASCQLGVTLYELLFDEFDEPMQRQEIVGGLVTHVGSGLVAQGGTGEADAALRAFCHLVDKKEGAAALRPFTPFLTSLLEHLSHMTTGQVRRLFLLLFAVGLEDDDGEGSGDSGPGGGGGGACAEIRIVISKHLSLPSFAKKKIGIVGSVAYAVARSAQLLARQSIIESENALAETEATCLPGNVAVAASPLVEEITGAIAAAYEHCTPAGTSIGTLGGSGSAGVAHARGTAARQTLGAMIGSAASRAFAEGAALAFLLEELGRAVRGGRLAAPVREWLDETFQERFSETYVGEFEEAADEDDAVPRKGAKGSKGDGTLDEHQIPTNGEDLALLNGTAGDGVVPGELRFNISGAESAVYVRLLPLLLSHDHANRETLPVTLAPMFHLMGTLNDVRYGGKGLSEIDAVLECPLLLPSADCSGMEFRDLSAGMQWAVTSSYFFGTCWVRQLINSFIYAADECAGDSSGGTAPAVGSFTASSQGFNSDEVKKKIVSRLEALVELEEELRFTSSKCFTFAPPGLDILPAPKELFDDYGNHDDEENHINLNADTSKMSKEDKKAHTAAKKLAARRAKEKVKSKQKRLKARQKHEERLVGRALGALQPLDARVCLALGFAELSVMGSDDGDSQNASQGLSQAIRQVVCGGPVTTLLLKLLRKTLSDSLSEKKSGMSFRARIEGGSNLEEDVDDGESPYMTQGDKPANAVSNLTEIALASCEDSTKKSFELLDVLLRGGVFTSLYEHLAAVAELRCGPNRTNNDAETEGRLVETARCLFGCISSLMRSESLTRTTTGKHFLASILKQLAEGDGEDYVANLNKRRRRPMSEMTKLMGYVVDNILEIVTGAYTGDLEFALDGTNCIEAILECSQRISGAGAVAKSEDGEPASIGSKLSQVAEKLLRQDWPDDTKMNKGNVGKLLALYIEHSPNRMDRLANLVNDVLSEVPHLDKGKGVTAYPTCTHMTFGSYFSTSLEYTTKQLVALLNSNTVKSKDPDEAARAIEKIKEMNELLQSMFDLTKDYDSLAKKSILLQQLKFGARFIETFVSKAMPFFQIHFDRHDEAILDVIRRLQTWSRQLHHIMAHGKREKDAILNREAPRAKKALETFIHKVKAMLKKNGCMTAMWTRTLKAKDIDGTTINEGTDEAKSQEDDDDEEGGDSSSEDEEREAGDSEEDEDNDDDAGTDEGEYETDSD